MKKSSMMSMGPGIIPRAPSTTTTHTMMAMVIQRARVTTSLGAKMRALNVVGDVEEAGGGSLEVLGEAVGSGTEAGGSGTEVEALGVHGASMGRKEMGPSHWKLTSL